MGAITLFSRILKYWNKIKTFAYIFIAIEFFELLLFLYDHFLSFKSDGYIGNYNIGAIFNGIRWIYFVFVIPILVFKVSNNELIKQICISLLFSLFGLLILEIISIVLLRTEILKTNLPKYPYFKRMENIKPFHADISKEWGLWHYGDSVRHQSTCYDALYKRNSYGARDKERQKLSSKNRFIVLGDSFMEGYVIADSLRISNKLEAKTNIEHLNFACGSFGVTQEYLVYHYLARNFSHQNVIIGLLPSNDFIDDNIDKNGSERYRPYWVGKYPNYKLKYKTSKLEDSEWYPPNFGKPSKQHLSFKEKFKNFWLDNTHLYYLLTKKNVPITVENATNWTSAFSTFENEEWNRLRYSLEQIQNDANNKKIIVLSFPSIQDLVIRKKEGKKMKFSIQMEDLAKKNNWIYIDLLEGFYKQSNDWNSLFLSCDGHFSKEGHQLATDIVLQNEEYKNLLK